MKRIVASSSLRKFFDIATYLGIVTLVHCAGGPSDFKEYWGAFHLISRGGNPYDPQAMLGLQRSMEPGLPEALMMWNPPWLPLVLSPVLIPSYELSRFLWLLFSSLMLYLSVRMITGMLDVEKSMPHLVYLCALAFPVLECLRLGQTGFFLLLALSGGWYYSRKGEHFLAGLMFALLGAKPHLFIFVGVLVLFSREWTRKGGFSQIWNLRFLSGCIVGTMALWSLAIAVSPELPAQWVPALKGTVSGVTPAYRWRTATMASVLRDIFSGEQKPEQLFYLWLPCVAGVSGTVLWKLRTYNRSRVTKKPKDENLPLWTAVSVMLSPFAWPFDFVILLPLVVKAVHSTRSRSLSAGTTGFLLLLQLVSLISLQASGDYFGLWWYPLALVIMGTVMSWKGNDPSAAKNP